MMLAISTAALLPYLRYTLFCFFFFLNKRAPPDPSPLPPPPPFPFTPPPPAPHPLAARPPFLRATAISLSRSEEHTSELQSPDHLVCRLLLEKKKDFGSGKQH